MVAIIISITGSVVSGMVLFFLQRFFKNKAKLDEERDAAKRRENLLILKSIDAVGKLTYADSIAISRICNYLNPLDRTLILSVRLG